MHKRITRAGGQRSPERALRFLPQFVTLEDRSVPSTFYLIEPGLAATRNNGDIVTFNAGAPGEQTGLTFSKDFAFYNNPINKGDVSKTFAFGALNIALQAATANPGADEIKVAAAPHLSSSTIPPRRASPSTRP